MTRHVWAWGLALVIAGCGSKGDEGAQGPGGEQGGSGTPGASGSVGPKGEQGPAGPQGGKGDTGANGATGATGAAGDPGAPTVISERAKRGLDISPVPISLAGRSADEIERIGIGSYIANAVVGCGGCHQGPAQGGPPKYMGGGTAFAIDDQGHAVYARNLTPDATTGMKLSEAEFIEAMQTGKDFSNPGESLIAMPWPYFRWMTTADLRAIYAYLKAIPAVGNAVTADSKGPAANAPPVAMPTQYDEGDVTRALPSDDLPDPGHVLRGLAIDPLDSHVFLSEASPAEQSAFGRGSYIVNAQAHCSDCHTNPARDPQTLKIDTANYLTGGAVFPVPPPLRPLTHYTRSMSANLRGELHGFEDGFASFLALVQEGKHVEDPGQPGVAWPMPWDSYRDMTLEDLEAVYTYVTNLPRANGAADKATQMGATYCAIDDDCADGTTCNVATNECVGAACTIDDECGACQTCTQLKCTAPSAGSSCLTGGI